MRLGTVDLDNVFLWALGIAGVLGLCLAIVTWNEPKSAAAPTTDIHPSLRDEKHGVVCYVHYYNGHESMSCVRDLLDAGCAR